MVPIKDSRVLKNYIEKKSGILQPQLSHNWLVRFEVSESALSQDCFDFLTTQVVSCRLDLLNEEVRIEFEQPMYQVYEFFLLALGELTRKKVSLVFFPPNEPNAKPFLTLNNCVAKDHNFELSYRPSGSETACHFLIFGYDVSDFRYRILSQCRDMDKAAIQPSTQPV